MYLRVLQQRLQLERKKKKTLYLLNLLGHSMLVLAEVSSD